MEPVQRMGRNTGGYDHDSGVKDWGVKAVFYDDTTGKLFVSELTVSAVIYSYWKPMRI